MLDGCITSRSDSSKVWHDCLNVGENGEDEKTHDEVDAMGSTGAELRHGGHQS